MRLLLPLLAATMVHQGLAAPTTTKVLPYGAKPSDGSCRFLPAAVEGSKGTKYASVPGKVMGTCGRCIQVTCADPTCTAGSSVVAYVVDAPSSSADGIKLSTEALQALTSSPVNSPMAVTYSFTTCPTEFISGNILACSMEGLGPSYTPIQFANSYRVVTAASFGGQGAKPDATGFYFSTSPQGASSTIAVTLQAGSQNISGSATFSSTTSRQCVDLGVQFDKPSAAEGSSSSPLDPTSSKAGGASDSSSSSSKLLIPIICGAVGLVLVIAIVVCFVKRRRAAKDDDDVDYENPTATDHSAVHKDPVKKDPLPPPPPQPFVPPPSTTNGFPPTTTAAYARMDSDTPPAPTKPVDAPFPSTYAQPPPAFVQPPAPAFAPPVIPERAPAANSRVAHRASLQAQPKPADELGQSYSSMFNAPARHTVATTRDDRKSFDIDEERDDDEPVKYAPPRDNGVLTSPESYVRATQMPRGSRPQAPTFQAPDRVSMNEQMRGSNAGYSRDSLNLLDYSRTKKQGSQPVQF